MSPLAERILYGLLQSGLTVSLVALLVIGLRHVWAKRYPARAMCLVWAVLAIRLLLPVQLTLPRPLVEVAPTAPQSAGTTQAVSPAPLPVLTVPTAVVPPATVPSPAPAAPPAGKPVTTRSVSVPQVLFALWGVGAIGYLARQFGGYAYLCRQLKRDRCTPERAAWLTALAEQQQALGIRRRLPLYASKAVRCPMLVGFRKPALYLPLAMLDATPSPTEDSPAGSDGLDSLDGLGDTDIAFIFRHELMHYKHGDLGLKLLLVLAQAVQWWNPLIACMMRFAQEDIELACDAAVVKDMDAAQRRAYGETILRSAIAQTRQRKLVSCFAGEKETLMKRLEGIFDQSVKKRGAALVVLIGVMLLTVGATFSIGKNSGQNGANGDDTQGESSAAPTAQQRLDLAQDWAGQLTIALSEITQLRSVVRQDDQGTYVITETADILPPEGAAALSETIQAYLGIRPDDTEATPGAGSAPTSDTAAAPGAASPAMTNPATADTANPPQRQAYQLAFARNATTGQWEVSGATALPTTVSSLELFRVYYENDFGLPDWMHGSYAAIADQLKTTNPQRLHDPVGMAQTLLKLDATPVAKEAGDSSRFDHPDIREETFAFADGSRVSITMVNQYDQVWFPQDWSDATGNNRRTTTDLAEQLARGVQYKSGQFVYPILSDALRDAFVLCQRGSEDENEPWYWKLGGSSPSYRWFVNLPSDPDKNLLVFQKYGGGLTDARAAYEVTVGTENGRAVITDVTACAPPEWKQTELFQLYYDIGTGMPMPDLRYGDSDALITQDYNGRPMEQLTDPRTAAEAAFSYFGEWVEVETPEGRNVDFQPWFTIGEDVTWTSETTALVTVHFSDNTLPVTVQMEKQGDYWLPVVLVFDYDTDTASDTDNNAASVGDIDNNSANAIHHNSASASHSGTDTGAAPDANASDGSSPADATAALLRVDAHIGNQTIALPVGATPSEAFVQDVPFLPIGAELSFSLPPSGDGQENITLSIADAMFREGGSLMFDSRLTETTELFLTSNSTVNDTVSQNSRYIIRNSPAALLRSTLETTELRGLTLTWTQNGVSHTAATAFRTGRCLSFGEPLVEIVQDPTYTNTVYGYTLQLPDSFLRQGFIRQDFTRQNAALGETTSSDPKEQVQFGMVGAMPESSTVGTTGFILSLHVEPTAFMEEIAETVPTTLLAERNGMSYFLTFASDVQYDPNDPAIAQTYQQMMADAAQLDASAFSFLDTDGEEFLYNETRTRLSALGHNLARVCYHEWEQRRRYTPAAQAASIAQVRAWTVIPEVDTMSCVIVYSLFQEESAYEIRRVERATFDQTHVAPISLNQNVAASDFKGTTLEKFLLLYCNPLGLPQYTAWEITTLQRRQQAGEDDLSTPEAGSLRYAMSEAYATRETISEVPSADTRLVQYRFWDTQDVSAMQPGKATVRFTMRAVQVDPTLPPVWLAESADVDCGDGTGWLLTAGMSDSSQPSVLAPDPD